MRMLGTRAIALRLVVSEAVGCGQVMNCRPFSGSSAGNPGFTVGRGFHPARDAPGGG
ncbi:hypothetical protein F511_11292 [Dorcoceras hygrometricum]|uniref:Uncharacterized protein n=1 Tax=Dorcoceras hygrometricum TaxID=472368 RepID=A0A2Z7CHA3_9LAMI|nr:hypothetical protein F511_11292 [Dorcoceras hygrometricum]